MTDAYSSEGPGSSTSRRRRYRRRHGTVRDQRLTPRFSEEELSTIADAAEAAQLTLTGFCALAALAAARRSPGQPRPAGDPDSGEVSDEELAEMQRELFAARVAVNRAGTNLNQAVAEFNTTGRAPVWLEHVTARVLAAVEQVDAVASRIHHWLR